MAVRHSPVRTVRDLLSELGGVPAWRVACNPPPGTATARHLIRLNARKQGLFELVRGTLVQKATDTAGSYLVAELCGHVGRYLDRNDVGFLLGPNMLFAVAPDVIASPDLSLVGWDQVPDGLVPSVEIGPWPPRLVVEVLSNGNTRGEVARKLGEYFQAGVLLVWVIDPAKRSAEAFTGPDVKAAVEVLDGGAVLPGFRLPLAKLFERLAAPAPAKKPRKGK